MSALATPMIHTVNARVNPSPMVNAEQIVHVSTFDRPGGRPSDPVTDYLITFVYKDKTTGGNHSIDWVYDDAVTRDADYALVLAAISTAI